MSKALTVAELAEYLGLAKDTIYRKAKAGEIPGVRIGRSWRFPQDVIDEWLREKAEVKGKWREARDKGGKADRSSRRQKPRFTTVEGGEIIGKLSREVIYEDRLKKQEVGGGRHEAKGKKTKKLPFRELKRRQRLVKRILETRKAFEKLPVTADEAYQISRRELERRPLRWK